MIKAVLFDHGGVLLEGGQADSISNTIFKLYGVRLAWDDLAVLHTQMAIGRIDSHTFFSALAQLCGSERMVTEQEWRDACPDVYIRSAPVYDFAVRLRQQGFRTGIVSNVYAMTANEHKRLGNYDNFEPLILSCEIHLAKPDRVIYEHALERLAVPADNVIFVDDQEKCLSPAQQLGMHTVLATGAQQIVDDVSKLIKSESGVEA